MPFPGAAMSQPMVERILALERSSAAAAGAAQALYPLRLAPTLLLAQPCGRDHGAPRPWTGRTFWSLTGVTLARLAFGLGVDMLAEQRAAASNALRCSAVGSCLAADFSRRLAVDSLGAAVGSPARADRNLIAFGDCSRSEWCPVCASTASQRPPSTSVRAHGTFAPAPQPGFPQATCPLCMHPDAARSLRPALPTGAGPRALQPTLWGHSAAAGEPRSQQAEA